jgi:hypothetical protein
MFSIESGQKIEYLETPISILSVYKKAMAKLDQYIHAATRDNTRRSYQSAIRHFPSGTSTKVFRTPPKQRWYAKYFAASRRYTPRKKNAPSRCNWNNWNWWCNGWTKL